MKKTFSKEFLTGVGLPYGPRVVRDTIEDVSRWSVIHELTFTLPGQDADPFRGGLEQGG